MSDNQRYPLSDRQRLFLKISAYHEDDEFGAVLLKSTADWRAARSLVKQELGRIEHDAGEQGKFIANDAGAQIVYPERAPAKRRC